MAPVRPQGKNAKSKPAAHLLLQDATVKVQAGDYENAAKLAERALQETGVGGDFELAALNLLGLAYIELGEVDAARTKLLRAVEIDGEGTLDEATGGGPEKFLWLAQISEEGGQDSVAWYEKGAVILRRQIAEISGKQTRSSIEENALEEKRQSLAGVLCAVAEVYMTDLSWEEDAEGRCEALVTEATMVCPTSAETWQTVASVRISQERVDDARGALERGMEVWRDLPEGDIRVPAFPTRVSLARLLMEVEMEDEAMWVLERLLSEDDESVETWYLGGWCQYIQGTKAKGGPEDETKEEAWRASRYWLNHCVKLFEQQEYEDERLGEHATELLEIITKELGPMSDDEDEGPWEDEESDSDEDEDEEMT
ncbi:related to TPR domain protein [Cephalotrichum gorgonifer]|uniref:Related to TPR domain protein n=1 Tax=Cephalotrichum gorgonifer TaxID=2041049 RepID=A0AAE8SQY2_9PEZI|nr:related to TPR domain protein [Cephalotrichum gorgonifer]